MGWWVLAHGRMGGEWGEVVDMEGVEGVRGGVECVRQNSKSQGNLRVTLGLHAPLAILSREKDMGGGVAGLPPEENKRKKCRVRLILREGFYAKR